MKFKNIFLFTIVLFAVGLLIACNPVKNSSNKSISIVKAGTAIIADTRSIPNKNKYGETIYFKASGTEPFWGLEITDENFRFTSVGKGFETFNAPHTEPIRAMDANVKRYRSMPDLGEMKIQIAQIPCTDDMSGKENKYQVTVELKRGIDQDFKIFKGCGNYVTDYRLHDIWMLEEINGQSINVTQYDKERPRIEINAEQNTFLGSTGSHDINGKIFFERGLLRFIDIAVPQNLNAAEKDFIKNIQSATNYKLEDYRMVLFNPSGELLKFRKTD
jgi:uncharacterized membrane protein/heat shock protein HslJ